MAMKVRELIEQLQACDPDADVLFVYNHSRTDVAALARYAGAGRVFWSDHHRMDVVADDGDDDRGGETREVVLIF
jgi:hypothetical protein